jgi:immunity protein 52 of polymorphic toxin system
MPATFHRIESYYAGAYWGPRKESPEECARRAQIFLTAVAEVDPSFSRWFQTGRSRKEALKRPIEPTHAVLEKLVHRGRDRQFEELGYSVWAWNGVCVDYEDSGFHFTCGAWSEAVSNACVFNLPTRGPNAERVLTVPVLTGLVRSMVLAWEPNSVIATSSVHMDRVTPNNGKAESFVGWLMYFPRSRGTVPPLPAPTRIEPMEDKGTLVILTPERFTADNPEHVEHAQSVHRLLDKAGLLQPVWP